MPNWIKKLFKREPKWKFVEGQDFDLVADLQKLKCDDPYPWDIRFLKRLVRVHSVKLPGSFSQDGKLHVDINIEILQGQELNPEEQTKLGDLLMELVQRNLVREK